MPNPKTRKYPRVYSPTGGKSMTKQSFKDECNINKIMDKFQKTGAIDHYVKFAPEYGDATPVQLADAMNIVSNAETMFQELPATLRKKFGNDPEQFLEFVQDPKNAQEMYDLGLRETPPVSNQPDAKVTPEVNASASAENTENGDVGQES